MQNWDFDPKTGDYIVKSGAPVQTNSLRVPAYVRLKTVRGGWLYAPNSDYGSDLKALKKRQSTRDATAVENAAGRALLPIVNDGRSSGMEIATVGFARNAVGLQVKIVAASGSAEQLNLPSIGA